MVAVYNALKWLGKFKYFINIIHDFESLSGLWADGVFGTYPHAIAAYMFIQGFHVKTYTSIFDMDKEIKYGRCFIIVYAHSRGIHTIMVRGAGIKDGVYAYNYFSAKDEDDKHTVYLPSISSIITNYKSRYFIAGFWIY